MLQPKFAGLATRAVVVALGVASVSGCQGGRGETFAGREAGPTDEERPQNLSIRALDLLGSSHGGHVWHDFCESRGDDANLPVDPRALVQPGVNAGRAVLFNAWWKDCHIDPELVGEKAHPKTCGELREWDAAGARLMRGMGGPESGSVFAGDNSPGFVPADTYNKLWLSWGLTKRPDNFDELVSQRYGMPMSHERNPYPLPDEDPNQTDGGSGQLPTFMTQLRNPDGSWSGKMGFTCHACHSGAAGLPEEGQGLGELIGSGNSLQDIGLMARELGMIGPPSSFAGLALALFATNRGTNNAQFGNIVAAPDSPDLELFLAWLSSGSTASMDTPPWWNLPRKPIKFADGILPADAVRVDLAFYKPLLGNDADAWVRAHAQDADIWIGRSKAPAYPLPIDRELAEQGAILFHALDLWSRQGNPAPRPAGGNGSCASCHGVYAGHFANDPAFLEDPRLRGIASYITPIDIINTDAVRLDAYNEAVNEYNGGAFAGYPETIGTEQDCGAQNRADLHGGERAPGYIAPPLHGIWASAPYFHNGSVPDVWGILDPESRPALWRRASTPARADQMGRVVMGFDTSLRRAYDAQRLGWKYDTLSCGDGTIPVLDCDPLNEDDGPLAQEVLAEVYGNAILTWNAGNAPVFAQLTPQQVENRKIYNTHLFSQGNAGHDFTIVLSDRERAAIIEYLKTL